MLLRRKGSDDWYLCHSSHPELQVLRGHKQKSPLAVKSHTKKFLTPMSQRFDLVARETGAGKGKTEKGRREENVCSFARETACLVLLRASGEVKWVTCRAVFKEGWACVCVRREAKVFWKGRCVLCQNRGPGPGCHLFKSGGRWGLRPRGEGERCQPREL